MISSGATIALRVAPLPTISGRRVAVMLERSVLVYRRSWMVIVSGFFEPLFYLLSIGVGIGHLVGTVPGTHGISYQAYVAPALLASSAMNGAVYDSTLNVYFKLKFARLYDSVLATPIQTREVAVGEISWSLLRGGAYAAAFVVIMAVLGLVQSWWALLAWPVALLMAFAFASIGMAGTSYMRSWQDFQWVQFAVLPLFLFSATFYPVTVYPEPVQVFVQATPLYQGVASIRALTTGDVHLALLGHVAYLAAMGALGLWWAARRLDRLLLT